MYVDIDIDGFYIMSQVKDFSHRNARRRFLRDVERKRRELRKLNEEIDRIEIDDAIECNRCSSQSVIKWGRYRRKVRYFLSRMKRILVQRYRCLVCGKTFSISNNPGIMKWYVNVDRCYEFWCNNGTDCSNCVVSCPFTKPDMWPHRLARSIIRRTRLPNGVFLRLDRLHH